MERVRDGSVCLEELLKETSNIEDTWPTEPSGVTRVHADPI
jgi:hypothetical protein